MSGHHNASSAEVAKPARTGTELLGLRNRVAVLKALRRHGRLSHTELSDHTGLASATVSAITSDLERAEVIEKSEQQAGSGRGRPRVLFAQRRGSAYLIIVIISSDAIQYSLVDYAGKLIDRFVEPRMQGRAGDFLAAIGAGLERVLDRSRIARDRVRAISISSKGLVAADAPVLRWSPVLGTEQVDFEAGLKPLWGARLSLSNETLLVASALGQQQQASAAGFTGVTALSLGHSIGLGIATARPAGEIEVRAPNFGHMLHVPNGALCRCGARGCVEAYAGLYGILRTAFEVPLDTIPAKFVPIPEVDKLAASARSGNRMANYAFRVAGQALGFGLSRVFSLNSHMPVAITGPGARYFDLMRAGMEEGLSQSQVVRMEGMPILSVVPDEPQLVFQGHLERAMALVDEDIVMSAT
ncbi:ROK family transcriptional regulator [Rhizobium sp. RU36D]|uniref:ROK family transcriptional regulator n=1 Tax=Rhizobium sp. RU36D TaxID=1907415 RepID=UPI0009D8EB02|nr:ROK family transcriptional regulator [Rhizobium sp. RU36D]SMC85143.1 Sugar kinase of the NBD/HSP70 family, may contain an N-terminal HTH domain [Rhizobium sp. RU36D]